MPAERVTVMGVGNPLMRDEGVGVRVAEVLMSSFAWPENVTVLDAGTMGMGILNLFRDADYVLVVDAVDGTGEAPGTVVRISAEDIAPNQVMHSLHDVRFVDVLEAAELMGIRPDSRLRRRADRGHGRGVGAARGRPHARRGGGRARGRGGRARRARGARRRAASRATDARRRRARARGAADARADAGGAGATALARASASRTAFAIPSASSPAIASSSFAAPEVW